MNIIIRPSGIAETPIGRFACSIGRSGITRTKREGDGATPAGRFPLRRVLWRPDRQDQPQTDLPTIPLSPDDGWCDDPGDHAYNRPVKCPYPASHETLWREDSLYDLIVVIGHNDDPVVPFAGSAVFIHLRREDGDLSAGPTAGPTAGCVAFARADLLTLLRNARPGSTLDVRAESD